MQNIHIFIGYDDREKEAYQVAKYSLEKYSAQSTAFNFIVHPLCHKELRSKGLYTRGHSVLGDTGQYIDDIDGRPFSTQFTFTRFLVPSLWRELDDPNKSDLVMFCDCDFMFIEDITIMFKGIEDQRLKSGCQAPVYVVQHNYDPHNKFKMDRVEQHSYNMKLWAALMVFDMSHPDNNRLVPEQVNSRTGRELMNFFWVSNVHQIGDIPEVWQYIPDHSEKNTSDRICCIHWTEGGPYFSNYRDAKFKERWFREYKEYLQHKLSKGPEGLEEILDCK